MTVSPHSLALDILDRVDGTHEPRRCDWCDAQFWPSPYNLAQRFCSVRCRTRLQNVRVSEERAAKRRDNICEYCGETFTPSIHKPDARFCSATCRQRHRRQRLRAEKQAKRQTPMRAPKTETQPKPKTAKKPAKEQRAAITPPESKVRYSKGTYTDEQMFAELERIGRELGRHRYRELTPEMAAEVERRRIQA